MEEERHAGFSPLNPGYFGEVLDPHEGQLDLEAKRIRVLHQRSFIDDPTRIFRALRYEQRLGFSLQEETENLLRRDAGNLGTVTGER